MTAPALGDRVRVTDPTHDLLNEEGEVVNDYWGFGGRRLVYVVLLDGGFDPVEFFDDQLQVIGPVIA